MYLRYVVDNMGLHNNSTRNSLEQSTFWQGNSCSDTQEICYPLRSPTGRCCAQNSLPLHYILSQISLIHILFFYDPFNIVLPFILRAFKWSLPLRFSSQMLLLIYDFSHVCFMPCSHRPPWCYHPCRPIVGEQYKWWSYSLPACNFLRSPFTASLLDPTVLIRTLLSNTSKLHPSHQSKRPSFIPMQYII
jgi:hypothetical protein